MGKVGVLRKQEEGGAQIAPTYSGSGGMGMSFILPGSGVADPYSESFQETYGPVGSDSHNRAVTAMKLGRYARYGLAGLGALNSAYNQMASGEPGLGGAVGQGAMAGWYGSSGLENFAARPHARRRAPPVDMRRFDEESEEAELDLTDTSLYGPSDSGSDDANTHEDLMALLESQGLSRKQALDVVMDQIRLRRQDILDNYGGSRQAKLSDFDSRRGDIARHF